MRRIPFLLVILLGLLPGLAYDASPYHPHWRLCHETKTSKSCHRYTLKHETRHPTGHRSHCAWTGKDWLCIRFPTFVPRPVAPVRSGYWVGVYTTGYDQTGHTAHCCYLAGPGIVAVDPSVFPYGTRFYIPGYGYAIAEDTGAFTGYHLDVWFPTAAQCFAFTGYRQVEVLN